jgi:hypothetical protein
LQRQRAVQAEQQGLSLAEMVRRQRQQRLAEWRQQGGLSDHEVQFLQKHPEMIDFPQITRLAVSEAGQAGHERNTDGHFDFVKKAF